MRIGFAGTPDFAAIILNGLVEAGVDFRCVLTQPPRPAGRGRRERPSPVSVVAERFQLTLRTPDTLKGAENLVEDLDLLVVAAYGLILPGTFLRTPTHGCINAHASLLPRWRGASPVEHAILAGDEETGISIMRIEPKLDAGPVYLQKQTGITSTDTAESLTIRLAQMSIPLFQAVINGIKNEDLAKPTLQDPEHATYAPRLNAHDAKIRWSQSANQIHRQIRAFQGRSAAFTTKGAVRVRVHEAEIVDISGVPGAVRRSADGILIGSGQGSIRPVRVQLSQGSGKVMPLSAVAHNYPELFSDGNTFDLQ